MEDSTGIYFVGIKKCVMLQFTHFYSIFIWGPNNHIYTKDISDLFHLLHKINKDTKILEVNLFAFAYRLFHRDFSPINMPR